MSAPHSGGMMAVGLRLVHSLTCTLLFGVHVHHVHDRCASSIYRPKGQRDFGSAGNACSIKSLSGDKEY